MLKPVLNKLGLKRLEPYDGKLSRTVLRGWKSWKQLFYYPTLKTMILTMLMFISLIVKAEYSDEDQAVIKSIEESKSYVLQSILEKYKEYQNLDNKEIPNIKENNIVLRIFVSSSMSLNLLKNYAIEANKYKAVLVFKGLPQGSFKELIKYLSEIEKGGINAPMQIDDEAFDRFEVKAVPAFVLSSEPGILKVGKGEIKFDKVTGNIGLKAALVKFIDSGELKAEAGKCLEASY